MIQRNSSTQSMQKKALFLRTSVTDTIQPQTAEEGVEHGLGLTMTFQRPQARTLVNTTSSGYNLAGKLGSRQTIVNEDLQNIE